MLVFQDLVDRSIINVLVNRTVDLPENDLRVRITEPGTYMHHMPLPCYKRDEYVSEKSPPLWGRDNEGGKASDWSRIQNPAL